MEHVVRLERSVGRPLAVVRRQASRRELATVIPEACGIVWRALRDLRTPGTGRNVAVYLDCDIHLEVGVEVDAPVAGSGEVVGSATPSGLVATTTHLGPYAVLHSAHRAIQEWCEAKGYALAGPSWEVYGHWQAEWNADPSQIRTDVCYLLVDDGRCDTPAD